MADVTPNPTPAPNPTPNPTPNPSPNPTPAWYEGKADAETIGHWDNKGWKKDDPAIVAIEATKQARELQKHFGVPADQLLKLPKDATDEAGWKSVWSRLGVPDDAKGYDFSAVKRADGKDLDPAFVDSMRSALLSARVPKDRASDVIKAVVKQQDDAAAASAGERTARFTAERAELQKSWGTNFEFNKLTAMQGAKRLGVSQETVTKLEGELGYANVMEMFRKVGAGTNEDTFVDSVQGGNPTTRSGAVARLAELTADKEWSARLTKGGAAERREFDNLMAMIHGVAA